MAHIRASKGGSRWVFRRISPDQSPKQVVLALHRAPLEDFVGDYLVTSTNRALEGVHRKHWWGFAGRHGGDASLHGVYETSNYLVQASRHELRKKLARARESSGISSSEPEPPLLLLLPFADCVLTDAGPLLPKIGTVVHTCVPRHPGNSSGDHHLHTTMPHAWVSSSEEATQLLRDCYANVFSSILRNQACRNGASDWWKIPINLFETFEPPKTELSIGLPAIGCGYNGYPIETAANLALDAICDIDEDLDGEMIRCERIVVEVRFRETQTMSIWLDEVRKRSAQFRSIVG